jgi:hypothetical protein
LSLLLEGATFTVHGRAPPWRCAADVRPVSASPM